MPYDDGSSVARTVTRILRLVVPWIGLAIVIVVLWSFVSDYRVAVDADEPTQTVETTQTAGLVAGEPYVQVLSEASTCVPNRPRPPPL